MRTTFKVLLKKKPPYSTGTELNLEGDLKFKSTQVITHCNNRQLEDLDCISLANVCKTK